MTANGLPIPHALELAPAPQTRSVAPVRHLPLPSPIDYLLEARAVQTAAGRDQWRPSDRLPAGVGSVAGVRWQT